MCNNRLQVWLSGGCQDPCSSTVSAAPPGQGAHGAHSLTACRMMSFSFSENLPRFTSVRCRSDAQEPSWRGRPRFFPFAVTEASPPVCIWQVLQCKHSLTCRQCIHNWRSQRAAEAAPATSGCCTGAPTIAGRQRVWSLHRHVWRQAGSKWQRRRRHHVNVHVVDSRRRRSSGSGSWLSRLHG